MADEVAAEVDRHLEELFGDVADPVLARALERMRQAELPAIQVSAAQGRFLHVLALARGAQAILEIGTLGGYSTIWSRGRCPTGDGW